jgi:hypothetical protein
LFLVYASRSLGAKTRNAVERYENSLLIQLECIDSRLVLAVFPGWVQSA